MKIEVQSKKGLKTVLSIKIDKNSVAKKLEERLGKLKNEISLKGFRPGKVPQEVIKKQFGKALYGEVIDQLLRESSTKAINEKKIKVAGQPKIDLKSFGEGKDLNYELQLDTLPEIKLNPINKIQAKEYQVNVEDKIIQEKIQELSSNNKNFVETKNDHKAEKGNYIIFDYSATINGEKFEGSEGKDVQLELGKDLFLKNFDKQLIGLKKGDEKRIKAKLPPNRPKKELANQDALFNCKIKKLQKASDPKIDDDFAKKMGAKDLNDLKTLVSKQISLQFKQVLETITKKIIMDELEKKHTFEIPRNLIESEINIITKTQKKEDKEKYKLENENTAKSRIKIGLILNEIGEKNNLKVSENEINEEIQKQIKSMPGQEKLVLDYYKNNPSAANSIKGQIYEKKIIDFIKTKIDLKKISINTSEAQNIINRFNKEISDKVASKESASSRTKQEKSKKISKK